MMPSGLRKIPLVLLFLFLLTFAVFNCPASASDAREDLLVIGLLPEMNVFKQKQRFMPLAAYLSERMGIEAATAQLLKSSKKRRSMVPSSAPSQRPWPSAN